VVDFLAADRTELIRKLNGKNVQRAHGSFQLKLAVQRLSHRI
jgi:hypothetical protein